MPKPGAETEKLSYFAGRWTFENDVKPGPLGAGGRMTGTENCEWFAGGFHLICRSEGTGPMGDMKAMAILGYSAATGGYTYYGIDNFGSGDHGTGTVTGNTWNWSGETMVTGKPAKARYTMVQVSSDAYTWKWEVLEAGGSWITLVEGRETRVK